jgi:hypothetical protein
MDEGRSCRDARLHLVICIVNAARICAIGQLYNFVSKAYQ